MSAPVVLELSRVTGQYRRATRPPKSVTPSLPFPTRAAGRRKSGWHDRARQSHPMSAWLGCGEHVGALASRGLACLGGEVHGIANGILAVAFAHRMLEGGRRPRLMLGLLVPWQAARMPTVEH